MKFKRILAAVLSVLMLGTMFVFTASAEAAPIHVRRASGGANGFAGEALTATQMYDAENDIVYYNYVPKASTDWMHFGWHSAAGVFDWSAPMTVGMVMRTNQAGAVPTIRLCDRSDTNNKLTIGKKADALKGDGTWEIVWFETATADDVAAAAKNGAEFDGLTHVQCFAAGESADLTGNKLLGTDFYFDVAGYAFFTDTKENLADVDLISILGLGAPEITLTFDAQNGTEPSTVKVKSGAYVSGKVTFPAEPTAPEGKVFAGWATTADAAAGVSEADVPAADTTYYAIWAQDESEPGDVTLASLKIKGTNAANLGTVDLTTNPIVVNVPHNWTGDIATELEVTTTDSTATKEVNAGTFGSGSTVTVKNGSANVTYNIEYKQAEAGSKSYTPTGTVTSNKTGYALPYNGSTYTVSGTTFISPARTQRDAEIAGDKGTKIYYNTQVESVLASGAVADDTAKTVKGNANYYTIADNAQPAFEGGGAYGFVTMSDYPWARVKYYLDPGEDGKTVSRAFAMSSTSWLNGAADKGYAESTKKDTAVASKDPMVSGRWAYAYINLGEAFAEDYGFTYQFHFRPFSGNNFVAKNVMEVSAEDSAKAVPHSTNGHAVLFDDAFYLASVELFNEFPGTEDGLFEQIAPYAGLFTITDETAFGANDGTITGLTEDMEYRLKGAEEWIAYTAPVADDEAVVAADATFAPGTYEIRYQAVTAADGSIGYAASPTTEVVIKSALAAQPVVTVVNATAVGENDGKVTGVDSAMSYRAAGTEEWTAIAEGATEITDLAPGAYEFIYLADGEVRTENSEITTATVLVDFDTDRVIYLTSNQANTDTKIFDGSSYDKAYYVGKGADLINVLVKYYKNDETLTVVIVDSINLGGWSENAATATAKKVVFTGLTPDAVIGFACCNEAAGTGFAMQHFGYAQELVFENITIEQNCLAETENHQNEQGLGISGPSKVTVAESVKSGSNATRIRIYIPKGTPTGELTISGGNWEGIFSGVTYSTPAVTSGADYTVTLNGGSVNLISATRHQDIWAGDYTVIVNGGEVRKDLVAGPQSGAYAGDAYVEVNGGTVANLYTTAKAQRGGNDASSTDSGIKNGASVVVVNGGTITAFQKGAAAPGGSALIVRYNENEVSVPSLTGAESDYVIVYQDGGKVEALLETEEYTYQPVVFSKPEGATEFTASNNGNPITYTASKITGFKVTLPENYNTVLVNDEIVELTDGILALEDLSTDSANTIAFAATWTLKADLNGGSYGFVDDGAVEEFFENGMKVNSEDVAIYGGIPNADAVLKPYRSGYTLAGWALTADAAPEECVTFPYMMTGDTTLYAIWVEANDTILTADEEALEGKDYYVYNTESKDVYTDFVPSVRADLGEIEYYGAYSVTVMDAATGEEDAEAHFSVEIDVSDVDLDGKLLYVENAVTGGTYGLENSADGKYVIADVASGAILQVYTLDPYALYTLEGTYYAKRGEYTVDIYVDTKNPVNAGSIGIDYACAQPVDLLISDDVQYIHAPTPDKENNFIRVTWGVNDGEAFVGGGEKVHIGTLLFSMTEEEREWYLALGNSIGVGAMEKTSEIYDGEYYLVAEHSSNDLNVNYIPAMVADITDTVGPDDMVTVKGTVVMTAREDGVAPIESNYATLYWRHKGAATWNDVVIESENTNTAEVTYILRDVPADTEIEIYVEKNGYLTGKLTTTFEAKTEEETDEKPLRTADTIELVPGDIKSNADDACGDGKINIADFVRVLRGFAEATEAEYVSYVDINEDGDANVTDLGYVKTNFGAVAK